MQDVKNQFKMSLKLLFWIFVGIVSTVDTLGNLGQEGCGSDWHYFNDYCYLAVAAQVHFDSAKAVCMVKGATLTSLWGQDELEFLTSLLNNLNVIEPNSWIGSGVARNKWVWLDGSGSIDTSFKDITLPEASKDVCGFLTSDGLLEFVDCDVTKPGFVCKKPLDMIYVPSTMNISLDGMELPIEDSDEIIFERLWPPYLDLIILNMTSPNYIATVEVAHETDCAYRCYTVDECQAFAVMCKSARKCNLRFCRLLSGIDMR